MSDNISQNQVLETISYELSEYSAANIIGSSPDPLSLVWTRGELYAASIWGGREGRARSEFIEDGVPTSSHCALSHCDNWPEFAQLLLFAICSQLGREERELKEVWKPEQGGTYEWDSVWREKTSTEVSSWKRRCGFWAATLGQPRIWAFMWPNRWEDSLTQSEK